MVLGHTASSDRWLASALASTNADYTLNDFAQNVVTQLKRIARHHKMPKYVFTFAIDAHVKGSPTGRAFLKGTIRMW